MRKETRELRKNLVDFGEKVLRKSRLADKTICTILRVLHFGISIFTIGILLFGSQYLFFIVIYLNLLIYLLYFIFEGCLLSKLEHRFTNDEYTVIDPFLVFFNIELTNENRYKYSFISSIFGAMATYILYKIRFSPSRTGASVTGASRTGASSTGTSVTGTPSKLYDNEMVTEL